MTHVVSLVMLAVFSNVGYVSAGTSLVPSASAFSWPTYPTLEYATPRTVPSSTPTYAPPFSDLAFLVQNQTTTTWASIASPTDSAVKYGNVAWTSLWTSFSTITPPPFTTTVSPTEIPRSNLVKPTPLPFPSTYPETNGYSFPEDFVFGFTGAALQVEGAVKNEGRGPSISELELLSYEEIAKGGGSPDISDLNYYLYKQDIARLAAVGVQTYAFSISWSRILPFAVPGSPVNQEGIDHYDDLINTVLEYGMTPMVTLNHFDTPLYYQTETSFQGWDHPEFVEGFFNYAQIVLAQYSDRVGTWISFNEPTTDAATFHNYLSYYNIVNSHAKVVHFYREQIQGTGKWSMKLAFTTAGVPLDPTNASDIAAADRHLEFAVGMFANPLYLGVQVPESILSTLGSAAANFSAAELAYANGTCDFFAMDVYTVTYQTAPPEGIAVCAANSSDPNFPICTENYISRGGWDMGAESNNGKTIMYQYVRTWMKYMDTVWPSKYGLMITEFGWTPFYASSMTVDQEQADLSQTIFFQSFLNELLKSIHEDSVKIIGVLGWAFVSNWEWGEYDDHFGVQYFNNVTLERSYKRTIFDFVDFLTGHGAQ